MFSKALLVALLSLSLSASTFAAPTQELGLRTNGNQNEECNAVKTVTVTATPAAATAKGANNAAAGGAAANKGTGSKASSAGTGAATLVAGSVSASASAAAATSSAAAAAAGGSGSCAGVDLQSCLTLDPSVLATGFENNGQAVQEAGQVASLTSSNNFINFCATVPNLPITNGQQITTGSCNPAPMGIIAATTNMPSSKFQFPTNGATIQANTAFTISMAISNLETGNFVNADQNFFAAPQQVNTAGDIVGHSHVVVEAISSFTDTTPTTPTTFAFFKGLNDPAQNGVLTADVTSGLPAGTYRLASINTAANHQPVLVAIAQHGGLDDMVYFSVTDDGQPAGDNPFTGSSSSAASSAASTASAADSASASAAAATAAATDATATAASAAASAAGATAAASAAGASASASAAAGAGAGKGAGAGAGANKGGAGANKGGKN